MPKVRYESLQSFHCNGVSLLIKSIVCIFTGGALQSKVTYEERGCGVIVVLSSSYPQCRPLNQS